MSQIVATKVNNHKMVDASVLGNMVLAGIAALTGLYKVSPDILKAMHGLRCKLKCLYGLCSAEVDMSEAEGESDSGGEEDYADSEEGDIEKGL